MKKVTVRKDKHAFYDLRPDILFCLLTFTIYIFTNSAAYAGTPMADVLCLILGWMIGNLGVGLATVAIAAIGIAALIGKASWGMVMTVAVGISVLFGAVWLVGQTPIGSPSC